MLTVATLADALIAIAHPSHRDALAAEARKRFGTW